MLSRPPFNIRKLIPSSPKKQDVSEDYEGSYFYHEDDGDMDTLSKIKTWRPPMGLMKRSKPSIDIRRSEDIHRIVSIPPLPDTPQSSTTSLCSIDNGSSHTDIICLIDEADGASKATQLLATAKLSDNELAKFPKPKDLFAMRLFHRIEVDEMLPESTLREIRRSRAAHWTVSPELGATHIERKGIVDSVTPIEPLSLDAVKEKDLVTPCASIVSQEPETSQEGCQTPTAVSHSRSLPKQEQQADRPLQQPDSPTTKPYNGGDDEGALTNERGTELALAEAVLSEPPLPPPIKSLTHRRMPSRQLPPLPTISETAASGPGQLALSPTSIPRPLGSPRVNTEDYVFLKSTPYTLIAPAFYHGQIRLAKADLPISKLAAAVDDTLDWTAFQMAILGGAGDFFGESTDFSRPSEAELDEREELACWFNSFGFGAGALVESTEPRMPLPPGSPSSPRPRHLHPRGTARACSLGPRHPPHRPLRPPPSVKTT
ncbi:hypothetical protein N0V88_006485 [Collariella sp. IMI 366227]|nr:hypothetical protein N0V88_006485 [Collariella sp. IMI 366227]